MNTVETMEMLAASQPRWLEDLPRVLADGIFYVDIAEWGHDLIDRARRGELGRSGVKKAMSVLERGFEEGDGESVNLIVVGMFEAMQSSLYRSGELAELFESSLGPRAHEAWCDLIEGWTGEGVRTMARWAAVVRNGATRGYARRGPDGAREVHRGDVGGMLVTVSSSAGIRSERELTADEVDRELAWLSPLMSRRWVGYLSDGDEARYGLAVPFATLQMLDDGGPEIRYGSGAPGGGCFVTDGRSVFVCDPWWGGPSLPQL